MLILYIYTLYNVHSKTMISNMFFTVFDMDTTFLCGSMEYPLKPFKWLGWVGRWGQIFFLDLTFLRLLLDNVQCALYNSTIDTIEYLIIALYVKNVVGMSQLFSSTYSAKFHVSLDFISIISNPSWNHHQWKTCQFGVFGVLVVLVVIASYTSKNRFTLKF